MDSDTTITTMTDQQRFIHRLDSASLNRQEGKYREDTHPQVSSSEESDNNNKVLVGNPNPLSAVVHQYTTTTGSSSTSSTSEIFFYDDQCEYNAWQSRGDSVLHIDLKDWADILVVAPMSANTLAKAANGMCDNLLMCVLRAWPCRGSWKEPMPSPADTWQSPILGGPSFTAPRPTTLYKPIVMAPAMNTNMLYHPATRNHITTLYSWYNKGSKAKTSAANDTGGDNDQSRQPLTPGGQKQQKNREEEHQLFLAETVPKLLACGVQGDGAMASPRDIAITVDMALSYVYCRFTVETNMQMRRVVGQNNKQAFTRYIDVVE